MKAQADYSITSSKYRQTIDTQWLFITYLKCIFHITYYFQITTSMKCKLKSHWLLLSQSVRCSLILNIKDHLIKKNVTWNIIFQKEKSPIGFSFWPQEEKPMGGLICPHPQIDEIFVMAKLLLVDGMLNRDANHVWRGNHFRLLNVLYLSRLHG